MSLLRVSEIETKIQEWAAQLVERVVHIDLGFAAIVCKAFDDEELEHDGSERDFAESVRQAAVISAAFTDDSELESLANMLNALADKAVDAGVHPIDNAIANKWVCVRSGVCRNIFVRSELKRALDMFEPWHRSFPKTSEAYLEDHKSKTVAGKPQNSFLAIGVGIHTTLQAAAALKFNKEHLDGECDLILHFNDDRDATTSYPAEWSKVSTMPFDWMKQTIDTFNFEEMAHACNTTMLRAALESMEFTGFRLPKPNDAESEENFIGMRVDPFLDASGASKKLLAAITSKKINGVAGEGSLYPWEAPLMVFQELNIQMKNAVTEYTVDDVIVKESIAIDKDTMLCVLSMWGSISNLLACLSFLSLHGNTDNQVMDTYQVKASIIKACLLLQSTTVETDGKLQNFRSNAPLTLPWSFDANYIAQWATLLMEKMCDIKKFYFAFVVSGAVAFSLSVEVPVYDHLITDSMYARRMVRSQLVNHDGLERIATNCIKLYQLLHNASTTYTLFKLGDELETDALFGDDIATANARFSKAKLTLRVLTFVNTIEGLDGEAQHTKASALLEGDNTGVPEQLLAQARMIQERVPRMRIALSKRGADGGKGKASPTKRAKSEEDDSK